MVARQSGAATATSYAPFLGGSVPALISGPTTMRLDPTALMEGSVSGGRDGADAVSGMWR